MHWKIAQSLSDDLIEHLLLQRDLKTKKQQEDFFNPKLEAFEKDFQIPGIPKAKTRIEKAIKNGELILIFGDYDVDGIAGAAILYLGLTSIGAKVLPYIPHREKEGYGLSKVGLEFARDSGASLVITTDCGIVNFNEAKFAKEIGLDLIITDHHQINKEKPDCLCVIHDTSMCGAAVAWCLIRSLVDEKIWKDLLDLVAIATVADMMSLVGANRALVKNGLEKLNKTERVGLLALFNEAKIKRGEISSYEVGHIIAPRLNAMGRLEHAIDSLRLLCTKDPQKARKLADLIAGANAQRKLLTTRAVDEAKILINGSEKRIHILSSKDWIPGIVGLVAGRVCEETKVPAIAISVGETYSKGSARSIAGINIVEVIRECSDILVAVGGHPGAAGFTIETTRISEFQQRLELLIEKNGHLKSEEVELLIDGEINSKKLTMNLVKALEKFEPFGLGNPKPILITKNMRLSDVRTVGEGRHLKGKADGVDFIAFNQGHLLNVLKNGQLINLAYNLEIDRFGGYEKLQLKIKDIK